MVEYKPYVLNIAITQKCNFNCKYCFTTKDASPRASAFTLEEYCKLLDEAKEFGIKYVILYGGEPLLHKDFELFIDATYARGILIKNICTNGLLLNSYILEKIKMYGQAFNFMPYIDISYDGLGGFHDDLTQTKTSKKILENIEKTLKKGFYVTVHMVSHKLNECILKNTIEYMQTIGVQSMRILKLMPSPKWVEAYGEHTEYNNIEWYDLALDINKWFINKEPSMDLEFWQATRTYSKDKIMHILPIHGDSTCDYSDNFYCPSFEHVISINGDGRMVPCQQYGGIMKFEGVEFENVKEVGLKKVLDTNSMFMKNMLISNEDRKKRFKECQECKHYTWCLGGCPLYGWRWRKDIDSFPIYLDTSKCDFFKNGYVKKINDILPSDWYLERRDYPWV